MFVLAIATIAYFSSIFDIQKRKQNYKKLLELVKISCFWVTSQFGTFGTVYIFI